MFQNIAQDYEDYEIQDVEQEKNNKNSIRIKQIFSIQNIILYVVSFLASIVSFEGEIFPFGLAIFAAACATRNTSWSFIYS